MVQTIPGLKGLIAEDPVEEERNGIVFNVYPVHRIGKPRCPYCGSMMLHKHDNRTREVRDLDNFGIPTILKFSYSSYDCLNCKAYYRDDLSDYVDDNARMTIRMRDAIAKRCFDYTFADVARDFYLNEKTCRRAYAGWLEIKEKERGDCLYTPKVLGIDESHIAGKMCGIFTDNDRNTILEISAERDKESVRTILAALRNPENLIAVTMDMWKPYRDAVYDVFGKNTIIVIDHFHVIQELLKQAVYCKNRLHEKADLSKGAFKNIAHPVKLYRSNMEDLSEDEQKDLVKYFSLVPGLKTAYTLKEGFRAIYSTCKTSKEASAAFDRWSELIPDDEAFNAFRSFENTVNNWRREIFNFFDYRYSNAFTECFNGLTKKMMRQGNGYSFEVLRGKMLYGTSATSYKKVIITKETDSVTHSLTQQNLGFVTPDLYSSFYNYGVNKYRNVTEIHYGADVKALADMFERGEFQLKEINHQDRKYIQPKLF